MPWSIAIRKRQLNWFGHMTRLPYNTPAKLALNHALKPTIRPRGQQKTTWISMMKKRFQEYDLKWEEACDMERTEMNGENLLNKLEILFLYYIM